MSIDGLKTFLRTNAIYDGYWIVETHISDGSERVAHCSISTPQKKMRVGASYAKEALHNLKDCLNRKLTHKPIILIDYTQGRILTCFSPTGCLFDQHARCIPFNDKKFFSLSQIKDHEPLRALFEKIFPDPVPHS